MPAHVLGASYYVGTSRMNVLRTEDREKAHPGFLPSVIAGSASINHN